MKKLKVWQLIVGMVLVVGGTTLFIVGVSGGLGEEKAVLDEEYQVCDKCGFSYIDLSSEDYEKLISDKRSFVVMVDQGGCTTADRLRDEFLRKFATTKGIRVHKMMFADVKKTSLNNFVKYYPSVAVISRGKVIGWLRADSDEDSDAYNKYEAFEAWMNKYLK